MSLVSVLLLSPPFDVSTADEEAPAPSPPSSISVARQSLASVSVERPAIASITVERGT